MSDLIDQSQSGTYGYIPGPGFEYVHSAPYVIGNDLTHNLFKAAMTLEVENKKPYNVLSKPSTARQKAISDGKMISLMLKDS